MVLTSVFAGVFSYTRTGEPTRVYAATSSNLNYQARLLSSSGNIVPDGYYNVEFKLYNVNTGGSALWTERYSDTNGAAAGNDSRVRVVNGYLSVNLGANEAFPTGINWDQDLWLTMNIGGSDQVASPTFDGEMTPRIKLTAVPYAFQAKQANRLSQIQGSYAGTLDFSTLTASRNILLPDMDGTLCIRGSSDSCGLSPGAGSGSYIQNGTAVQTANFNIQSANVASSTAVLRAISGQTSSLLQFQNASGGSIAYIDPNGLVVANNYVSTGGIYTVHNNTNLNVEFRSGQRDTSGNTGNATFKSGNNANTGNTGNVLLQTGNATTGNSGNITIDVGTASVAAGSIGIGNANASAISVGRAGVTTSVTGTLNVNNGADSNRTSGVFSGASGQIADILKVVNSASADLFTVSATGQLKVASAASYTGALNIGTNTTAASGGIYFGTDTNLYRSGSNTLTTDGSLVIGSVGGSNTLTINGSQGSISTSNTGNNLNFSRDAANYIAATGANSTLNFGAGGSSGNFVIGSGGNALFQNTTNSVQGFNVKRAGGSSIFNANTTANSVSIGQYQNLVLYSESFDNGVWNKGSDTTVAANNALAPNGTMTADTLTFNNPNNNNWAAQATTQGGTLANRTFTYSVWAKAGSTTAGLIEFRSNPSNGPATNQPITLTNEWQRFVVTKTFLSTNTETQITVSMRTNNATGTYQVWGAQLEENSVAGPYVPTTSSSVRASTNGLALGIGDISVRNGTNSATAFQIQNAAGSSIFNVNTLTGAATLSGNLTVSGSGTFNGILNTAATVNNTLTLSDVASDGPIGTAPNTVDAYTSININQTTAGRTLSLPSPTDITAGRVIYVNNIGSAQFSLYTKTVAAGNGSVMLIWNGSAWAFADSATGSGSGVNLIGDIDGQAKNNKGATINGTTLYLQSADDTNPGIVTINAQLFGGDKTFAGKLTGQSGASLSGGQVDVNSSGSFATNIGAGTNTGTIQIGSTSSGLLTLRSGNNTSTAIRVVANNGGIELSAGMGVAVTSNNASAFKVQTTAGVNVLNVNTTTGSVALGSFGGANIFNIDGSTGTASLGSVATGAKLGIGSSLVGLRVNQLSTNNLAEFQNNGSNVLTVGSTGATTIRTSTNSSTALSVQNSGNEQVFNVDNTSSNLITNSSFETNTTGWVAKGGATIAQDTATAYSGNTSLAITTGATADQGASFPVTLAPNTTYTLSMNVRVSTGSGSAVIAFGRQDDGATDANCTTPFSDTRWQRTACTFTTGSSVSNSNIYIKQTGAVARTINIDAVQLRTGSVNTSVYQNGYLQLNGIVSSPTTFQNTFNSTNGFQVLQAGSSSAILSVNTSDREVVVDGRLVLAGSLNERYVTGNTVAAYDAVVAMDASGYRVGTSITPRDPKVVGVAAFSNPAGLNMQVAKYGSHLVNADASYGAIAIGDQLVISPNAGKVMADNKATSGIVGRAKTALATGTGTVTVDLAVNGGLDAPRFQNTSDSTTAFQIQNAAGTNLFTVDSTNGRLAVGAGALPANGVLTVGTDTTVASGGIYFGTDTTLYRVGAGVLRTAGDFRAQNIQVVNNISANNATANMVTLGNTAANTTGAGITFGNAQDTNIYRSAAGVLKTDGALIVTQPNATTAGIRVNGFANNTTAVLQVAAGASPNTSLFQILNSSNADVFNINNGGAINMIDVNLYRQSSNLLQTDDSFTLNGSTSNLTVGGNSILQGQLTTAGLAAFGSSAVTNGQQVTVTTSAATTKGLVIKGSASQTANLLELQNLAGSSLFYVSGSGLTYSSGDFVTDGSFRTFGNNTSNTGTKATSLTSGTVYDAGSGTTGSVTVGSGSNSSSGNTGSVNLISGSATSGSSGKIVIDSGSASATSGTINIGTSNASGITIGRVGVVSTISGDLSVGAALTSNYEDFGSNNLVTNGSYETAANWTTIQSTLTQSTAEKVFGANSFMINNPTAAVSGGSYIFQNLPLNSATFANKSLTISYYAKADSAASIPRARITTANGTNPGIICGGLGSISVTTTWQKFQYSCSWPDNIDATQIRINIFGHQGNSTNNVYYDGIQVQNGSSANLNVSNTLTVGQTGNTGLVATFNGSVQGADATADNQFVTRGQLNAASNGTNFIQNSTGQQTANFNIQSASATSVGGVIRGASGQSVDIFQIYNGAGNKIVYADSNAALFASNGLSVAGSRASVSGASVATTLNAGNAANVVLVVRGVSNQTGDLMQIRDSSDAVLARFKAGGNLVVQNGVGFGGNNVSGTQLTVTSGLTGNKGVVIVGANGQTGDLFQVTDSADVVLSAISASGQLKVAGAINFTSALNVGTDTTTAAGGISFGSGNTNNLYRSNAAGLRTDAQFYADGGLFTGNTGYIGSFGTAANSSRVILQSGNSTSSGISGNVSVLTGNNTGTGDSGSITLQSGNASSGNSGSVGIDSGTASGVTGAINLGTTNASAITIGRSGIVTTFNGQAYVNTNSVAAFKVEQSGVNNNTFVVDTANGKVAIGNNVNSASAAALQVTGSGNFSVNLSTNNTLFARNVNVTTTSLSDGAFLKQANTGATTLTVGDVVVLANESNVPRVATTTTARDTRIYGVTTQASGSSSVPVAVGGNTLVNATDAAVAIGDQLVTSTEAGKVMVDNSATTGILGYATTAKAAGSVGTVGVRIQIVAGQNAPTFRNTTDSANAFNIQDAAGSNIFVADTTTDRIAIGLSSVPANAVLTVGTNTTAASGGIYFGTDTGLYRSGTNTLRTTGALVVQNGLSSNSTITARNGTAGQVSMGTSSTIPTILFGTAGDTNLYRSAANTLATDDSFSLVGSSSVLTVQGTGLSTFAGSVQGVDATASNQFATLGQVTAAASATNFIQNGTTQQTANFNISGNGIIGGNLTVNGELYAKQALRLSDTARQYDGGYSTTVASNTVVEVGEFTFTGQSQNIYINGEIRGQTGSNFGTVKYSVVARSNTPFTNKSLAITFENNASAVVLTPKLFHDEATGRVVIGFTSSTTLQNVSWTTNVYERANYNYWQNTSSYVELDVAGLTEINPNQAAVRTMTGTLNVITHLQTAGVTRISNTGVLSNVTADAGILTSGTLQAARLSGSYTGITGTGALIAGSIGTGFGAISTGNNISTTAVIQGGSGLFTGTVQGADATANNQFVTLSQLNTSAAGSIKNASTNGNALQTGASIAIQRADNLSSTLRVDSFSGQTSNLLKVRDLDTLNSFDVLANGTVKLTNEAGGNVAFGTIVYGDTNNSFELTASGQLRFGSGASGVDTTLYRQNPGQLRTDGGFVVSGASVVGGGLTVIGGVNNSNGGITNTGSIAGAATISASGNITTSAGILTVQGSGTSTFSGSLAVNGSSVKINNTVWGVSNSMSAPTDSTYYKIATLPASNAGTRDHIEISGFLDDDWNAFNKTPFTISMGNRGGFAFKYDLYGSQKQQARVIAYTESDGSVSVYTMHAATRYTTITYNITQAINVITYQNPVASTVTPTGTIAFDSSTSTARFMLDSDGSIRLSGNLNASQFNGIKLGFNTGDSFNAVGSGVSTAHYGLTFGSAGTNTIGISAYSGIGFYTSGQQQAFLGADGSMQFKNNANSTSAFRVQDAGGTNLFVVDTVNDRLAVGPSAVPANGVLTVGTNTTAATGGLYFGTDTNLYRSAADTLKTDDSLQVGAGLTVTGNSTLNGQTNVIASNATTQTALTVNTNSLTTGSALKVATTSSALTSGNLIDVSQTSVFNSNFSGTNQLLNVSRNLSSTGGLQTINRGNTSQGFNTNSVSNGTPNVSMSHTIANNSNRILLVAVNHQFDNISVTYGGTALTKVAANSKVSFFYIVNPTVGTANIVVTSNTNGAQYYSAIATDWYGVDGSSPISATGSGTASSTINIAAGHVGVDMYDGNSFGSYSPGSGQTQLGSGIAQGPFSSGSSFRTGAASSMSWSTPNGNIYAHGAVALRPATGAGSGTLSGSLVNFSNNCQATCADSSSILTLNQQSTGGTGAVLNILNAGTGKSLTVQGASDLSGVVTLVGTASNLVVQGTGNSSFAGTLGVTGNINTSANIQTGGVTRITNAGAFSGSTISLTGNATLAGTSVVSFGSATGDKLQLFGNTYGIGMESSTLTNWSASQFRWRIGGTSVSTGTERMLLTNTALNVTGNINASASLQTGGTTRIDSTGAVTTTGVSNSGGYVQSGATANTFSGATTLSSAGTALTVTNAAQIGGTLTLTGGVVNSLVADGASANGFILNVSNSFTTAGAKLISIRNNGTEKFAVDKDGQVTTASIGPASMSAPMAGRWSTTSQRTWSVPYTWDTTDFNTRPDAMYPIPAYGFANGAIRLAQTGYYKFDAVVSVAPNGGGDGPVSVCAQLTTIENTTELNKCSYGRITGGNGVTMNISGVMKAPYNNSVFTTMFVNGPNASATDASANMSSLSISYMGSL